MKNEPCGHDIDDWIEPKNESDPFCLGCVRKLIREEAKKEVPKKEAGKKEIAKKK